MISPSEDLLSYRSDTSLLDYNYNIYIYTYIAVYTTLSPYLLLKNDFVTISYIDLLDSDLSNVLDIEHTSQFSVSVDLPFMLHQMP